MPHRPTILWDWNGTLLDDLEVCRKSINQMLNSRRLPELTREYYRQVFTFPVRDYYAAVGFDFTQEAFEVTAMEFIALYTEYSLGCPLADGARETLAFFAEQGYRQVILSAMEHEALRESVSMRGIASYFDGILGISNHYAASKVENAQRFVAKQGLDPAQVTFIGDTLHDAEVADALGCHCLLVANGHQAEERLRVTGRLVLPALPNIVSFFEAGKPI